jgi:hypothetical protein
MTADQKGGSAAAALQGLRRGNAASRRVYYGSRRILAGCGFQFSVFGFRLQRCSLHFLLHHSLPVRMSCMQTRRAAASTMAVAGSWQAAVFSFQCADEIERRPFDS